MICHGAAARAIRLNGPIGYANLTLKRGMTDNFDLWTWFEDSVVDPRLRADAEVVLLGPDGSERARFQLSRCVPIKMKAPTLSSTGTAVAITVGFAAVPLCFYANILPDPPTPQVVAQK